MLYRIKQFFWAITSPFCDIKIDFLNKYLNKNELNLFLKLKKCEQLHALRVAEEMLLELNKPYNKEQLKNINREEAIKLALLHDIGKEEHYINVILKSLLVIINKIMKKKLYRYTNIKTIDVFLNHGEKGYEILKSIDIYSNEFLEAVRIHHDYNNITNKLLVLLRECDDKS